MQRTFRLCALALGATLLAPIHARGDRLPLGLDIGSGIFLQEIWQAGTPHLCVANSSGNEQTLVLSRWRSRAMPAEPLLRWRMDAHSTVCHDVSALAAESLIEYRLAGGKRVGLLRGPGRPDAERTGTGGFASFSGINGTCPTPGNWTEQPSLWLKGGQAARVDLLLTVGADGALMEFPADTRLDLPHLTPRAASAPTLRIEHQGSSLLIKADPGTGQATVHRVQLEIDLPTVTRPTMYLLSGRKRIDESGWQCFVRGILVEP